MSLDCAHCEDELDNVEAVTCPACALPICEGCLAMSTPQDCMHWGDDSALDEEEEEEE